MIISENGLIYNDLHRNQCNNFYIPNFLDFLWNGNFWKCNGKDDADTVRKAMNAVKFKLVLRMFAVVRQKHTYKQLTTI